MNNIALRSFQSELSHLFAGLPLLINGKIATVILFIILASFHLYRYLTHFDEALIISKKQINKWYYNLLDYAIIIVYQTMLYNLNNNYLLFLFAAISGMVSFYFIYLEHRKKTNVSNNLYIDLFMIISLLFLFFYEKDNRIRFFCIRDIIYHINEFIFFY